MALSLLATLIQTPAIKMEVIYSEIANLTYHLDTAAGLNRASDPSDIEALWKRDFLKSADDRVHLDRWTKIRQKYDTSVSLPTLKMPFAPRQSHISLGERIRSAGLEAKSFDEYEMGLNLLVLPAEVGEFTAVIRHFQPTFHRWWETEAAVKGKTFTDTLQKHLNDPKVAAAVERFRRFYGSQLPDGYRAPFSLIYRPMIVKTSTSGEQLSRTSVVEFLPTERPEQRLDVVLHEFCHFLYGTRSPVSDQLLQDRFLSSSDPAARPCYNLMNEGLATAMGNGIIGRMYRGPEAWKQYVATPNSFYNNTYIDRAGKRLLKLLEAEPAIALDDPRFVPTYLSALKEAIGDELTSPTLFLNESFIYVNQGIGQNFARRVMQTLRVSGAWTRVDDKLEPSGLGGFQSLPHLSAIFVVPPSAMPDLVATNVLTSDEAAKVGEVLKTEKSTIFAKPRGSLAYIYVLVASDETEAGRRLDQLAAAKKGFNGIAALE